MYSQKTKMHIEVSIILPFEQPMNIIQPQTFPIQIPKNFYLIELLVGVIFFYFIYSIKKLYRDKNV